MLAFLLRLINPLSAIAREIAAADRARQEAKTDRERIMAEERIARLEAVRDVHVAEARSPINGLIRALFALPVALYYGKIFVWDKVLALGKTDPLLTDDLVWVAMTIIGFYFLADGATAVARIAKSGRR